MYLTEAPALGKISTVTANTVSIRSSRIPSSITPARTVGIYLQLVTPIAPGSGADCRMQSPRKTLREQESLVLHYVDLLVEKLRAECAAARSTVDMMKWYNYTTFDIFGDMAFGELLNCLRDNRYQPWVVMVYQSVKMSIDLRLIHLYPLLESLATRLLQKRPRK